MVKLKDIKKDTIVLGEMTAFEAIDFANKVLDYYDIPNNNRRINEYFMTGSRTDKRPYYLRHKDNDPAEFWVVSSYINEGLGKEISIKDIDGFNNDFLSDRNGYTINKYYAYKKGEAPSKIGHDTYDDAVAEINKMRESSVVDSCQEYIVMKCVGIHYAEVEYKEIKGE